MVVNKSIQHAGATTGAHEHILTAVQRLFTTAGYKTDRKHVPHSRGLKKADLVVKDFSLAGIRDLIIDVSLRHEFRGALRRPRAQRGSITRRRQRRARCRCQSEARKLPTRLQRAQLLLPSRRHVDLRENQQ